MSLQYCLLAFGVAFAAACGATPVIRWLAKGWGVVDRPDNFRKVHHREVPRLGGVAIYVAFLVSVAAVLLMPHITVTEAFWREMPKLMALLLGAAVALGLGIFDDVFELPARWKLVLQVAAATVAFLGGYRIQTIGIPFHEHLPFGEYIKLGALAYPATVLWFLACMNAINLLDGLDGLAAGASLFAAVTLFLVAALYDEGSSMLLMACLAGSALGFLVYNFYPASIFLGDSGSMLLGFMIAALALFQKSRKTETALTLLVPLIALGLPLFDTLLAILRRWSRRLPISAADRQHIHHVLMSLGLSHRRVVLILYGACVVLGAIAYVVAMGREEITVFLLSSLAILAYVSVRVFGGMRVLDVVGRVSEDFSRMGRSAKAKLSVERSINRLAEASSYDALWAALSEAFTGLDIDAALLEIKQAGSAERRRFAWPVRTGEARDPADSGLNAWFARLAIRDGRRVVGELRLTKLVHGVTLLPAAPDLVERLRSEIGRHVTRLLKENEAAAPVRDTPLSEPGSPS